MTPVVLLGHGSPDPRSAAGLRKLARAVARRRPDLTVEVAFLGHDDPGLTGLCLELAWAGHSAAVVVPAFLTAAFHVRSDVPRAVEHAEVASGLRLITTDPIGPDVRLTQVMEQHLPGRGHVVLATAGTRDPDAQAQLESLAKEWSEVRGTDVIVAHAAMAEPDVATALATLERDRGAFPVVASYVLFPGVLHDRIAAASGSVEVSAPLGDDVAHIVLERVAAAA
jgi:sirohydrochlorin ferrochelatase